VSDPNATDYPNKKGPHAFLTTLKTLDTALLLKLEGKAGVGPANGGFAVLREQHEATSLATTGLSSSLFFLDHWFLIWQEGMIRRFYFTTIISHRQRQ
jgi:hypothetical protein